MNNILLPNQHPVAPGRSKVEPIHSYPAHQSLSLALSSQSELFNQYQILQISVKGNIVQQPIFTEGNSSSIPHSPGHYV